MKAELLIELDGTDDVIALDDVQDAINDIDGILEREEHSERLRWATIKDQQRK